MKQERKNMFLLILMLQALAIFAVDMNHRCKQLGESLLDCTEIVANNYQYSDSRGNAVTRLVFLRLLDTSNVELKNLKLVDTVIVQRGEAKCDQLKEFTGTVVIQLSDKSIVCDHAVEFTSTPMTTTVESTYQTPVVAAVTKAVEPTQLLQDVTTADDYTTKPQNQYLSTSSLSSSPNPPLPSINPPASSSKVHVIIIITIPACIMTVIAILFIIIKYRKKIKCCKSTESSESIELGSFHMELPHSSPNTQPLCASTSSASRSILLNSNESLDSVVELFSFSQPSLHSRAKKD